MLELSGTPATVEEIAQLAGTTATGTSVAGLLAAAKQKGLPLTAVEATRFDDLNPPFIAYVDGDHFLLVESAQDGMMSISDDGRTSEQHEAVLSARWSGVALVAQPGPALAAVPAALLDSLKGADGYGGPDPDQECDSGSGDPACGGLHDASITPWGMGGIPPAPPVLPPALLPGTPGALLCNTGVSSPGVHPAINAFDTSLRFTETDLQLPVDGALRLHFTRTYRNSKGFNRGEFNDTTKPWQKLGKGWTHNYNMFLQTSTGTPPSYVLWIDASGSVRRFNRIGTTSDYERDDDGSTASARDLLTRNQDGTYTLTIQESVIYQFSVPTTDANRYARLEAILDTSENQNQITLTYDSQDVATGKLTMVSGPAGDLQHYVLTYTNGLLTKVEFKKTEDQNTTLLQDVQFSYTANELTTVTDNDDETVTYAYGSAQGISASRYIGQVTDKRGNSTAFTWYYDTNGNDDDEAYKIELTNAAGLKTVYDRNLSSDLCTITNWDNTTQESKFVYTPVDSSTQKPRYRDYYLDATNYERWEHAYNGNGDMTQLDAPGQVDVMTYTYTTDGRFDSATVGSTGPETSFAYTLGTPNTSTTTGPDGLDMDSEYNAAGQVTLVNHPSIGEDGTQYGYDGEGNVTSITNPLGNSTTHTYDDKGNKTSSIVDPTGLVLQTSRVYDDLGHTTERTDPRGKTTTFTYNSGSCGSCAGGTGQLLSTEDPLGHVTEFEYDENGNRTLERDALDHETAYEYDAMNRLTKIISPVGSQNQMTFTYNKLGQLISQTSFKGVTTSFEYDHTGRQENVLIATESIAQTAHTAAGQVYTVSDGNGHTTTYTYDNLFRLVEVADPIGKETHYTYDSAGRRTKVAGGVNGDFDPTEYFYSSTTGLLEKVRYWYSTQDYDEALYYYDDAARLRELDDWIFQTAGDTLRYTYDAAGRLTTLTDYDDRTLTYGYDDADHVISLTDYHGNETTYAYDDLGRLTSMTAPGSRTWGFTYNGLNQPVMETMPNGMATICTYDTTNRLDKIDHKTQALFGTTVESFDYTLDDDGNITRIDEASGAFWVYGYDNRNRLTSAVYTTDWGHEAEYTYAYDDGDNMTQKVEPFAEDFNDGNYTGWNTSGGGTWSASTYAMRNDVNTSAAISFYKNVSVNDSEIRFSYYSEDTSNNNYYLRVMLRNNSSTRIDVRFYPNKAQLWEWNGSAWTSMDLENSATTTQATWYDVVAKLDGANVTVWRGPKGGALTEILSTTASGVTTNQQLWFQVATSAQFRVDDVKLINGASFSTWTMTPNNANELTQMTNTAQGATIDFAYDAYGRTTEKTMGANTANYDWRYGYLLQAVDSDFPGESVVTYLYRGDKRRHSRTENGSTTRYNWDSHWNIVSKGDANNTLVNSFVIADPISEAATSLAEIAGSSPSTGAYNYYLYDQIGSTRRVHTQDKSTLSTSQFEPYGEIYASTNAQPAYSFTGKGLDVATGSFYFPYRNLDPKTGRWLTRDPAGTVDGLNRYAYVRGQVLRGIDPLGRALELCHRMVTIDWRTILAWFFIGSYAHHDFFRHGNTTLQAYPREGGVYMPEEEGEPDHWTETCDLLRIKRNSMSVHGEFCSTYSQARAFACIEEVPAWGEFSFWPSNENDCKTWAARAMAWCCLEKDPMLTWN